MNLVAVSRILNEDDIIESFVRHHAELVDHHLFLDNGSTDDTLRILRDLKTEGLQLTVLQNKAPFFTEVSYNTSLFRQAVRLYSADWVVFLDADEFIDTRPIPNGLKAYLENIEAEFDCVGWSIVDYFDLPTDDQGERTVPKRMKMRDRLPHHSNFKILARGSLANRNVFIDAGQHKALIDGEVVSPYLDRQLVLAHYPRRSAWQMISKSIMGYLKVIAAGQSELQQNRSIHYKNIFQAMRDGPKGLLEPNFVNDTYDDRDLVEDPIPYLGKPLRYTPAGEPLLKAIRVLTAYAEQLAEHHGMFIDTNEGVRMQAERTTAEWTVLF